MLLWLVAYLAYAVALSVALGRAGYRASEGVTSEPAAGPQRVLVIGATGGTGRQLVSQALERGHEVTAFVRDPARMRGSHPKLAVVQGDVLDAGSVSAAVRGHDAVLSALGHKRYLRPSRILSAGTRNVVQAMRAHGVRRLVCETSLGIGDSAGRMGLYYSLFVIPVILQFYFWDKTRQERIVADSGLDWLIVRPGALTNGAGRDTYRRGRRVGSFLWTARISRVDVAAFMLQQLERPADARTAIGICY